MYNQDYYNIINENKNPELVDSKIIVNNSFYNSEENNKNSIIQTARVLSEINIKDILQYFSKFKKYPVNLTGIPDVENQVIGSYRASVYNVRLAQFLTKKIFSQLPAYRNSLNYYGALDLEYKTLDENSFVNHNKKNLNAKSTYKLLGVSPLFRYMEYSAGSEGHVPHYDAPYEYSDNTLTLMTGILYLSTSDTGSTYFLPGEAQQIYTPMLQRNTEDWKDHYHDLVQCEHVFPERGKIILFDHQLAHGVAPFKPKDESEKRIIIRFDLIYKRQEN